LLYEKLRMFQISKRFKGLNFNGWTVVAIAIAALISTPVLFVLSSIFADSGEVWSHLASTVLPRYLLNSFLLSAGVGMGVCSIGV
jgi:iron(III) transport system permease protein